MAENGHSNKVTVTLSDFLEDGADETLLTNNNAKIVTPSNHASSSSSRRSIESPIEEDKVCAT